MKKRALYKDIFVDIFKSKSRFLSIMVMIALGSAIFVGLCVTGPTMRHTLFSYTHSYPLSDLSVSSPLGLETEDQVILSRLPGISSLSYSYGVDLIVEDSSIVLTSQSLSDLTSYEIVEGRLPKKVKELAMDSYFMDKGFKIGDKLSFIQEKHLGVYPLKNYSYTITGFINSPEYLMPSQKGYSTVGDGVLDGFCLITEENFQMDNYSVARINFSDTADLHPYSQEYKDKIAGYKEMVEEAVAIRPDIRFDKYHREALDEIAEGKEKISDAEQEILDANQELADAKKELSDGWREYYEGKDTFNSEIQEAKQEILEAEEELLDAKKELDDGQKKLDEGIKEFEDGKAELEDGKKELADAKKQLDKGEKQLEAGQDKIDNGWWQLAEESNKLYGGLEQINAALPQLESGILQVEEGLAQIEPGLLVINTSLGAINPALATSSASISDIGARIAEINTSISAIKVQVQEIDNRISVIENTPGVYTEPELQHLLDERDSLLVEKASLGSELFNLSRESALLSQKIELLSLPQKKAALEQQKEELLAQRELAINSIPLLEEGRKDLRDGQRKLDRELANFKEKKQEYEDAVEDLNQGIKELADAEIELEDAKLELADGYAKYNDGLIELEDGRLTLKEEKDKGEKELKDAYIELLDGESEYKEGLLEFNEKIPDAKRDIQEGKTEIKDAEKELARLKVPKYSIGGMYDNLGFFQYVENSESMDLLSYIFPVFFYLIALLISLTTMTRMVDEQRGLIGTVKALGYSNIDIAMKYLIYGSCASIAGCILGILAGQRIIMPVIFDAYSSSFLFREEVPLLPLHFSIIAVVISLLCTSFAAYMTIRSSLSNNVATLIRPKAPKLGNRIFLERLSFIWKRLSFHNKVTARNIFRYKKRMLMTIIGVAGCTALIFMGFGIRDSISDILKNQYDDLFHYDTVVIFDDAANPEEIADYKDRLRMNDSIGKTYEGRFEQGNISVPGMLDQQVSIVVPKDYKAFQTINKLQDRKSKEAIPLTDKAVISEKLAYLLKLEVGDNLEFVDMDDVLKTISISGITENYAGHYLYLPVHYYEEIFGQEYASNAHYITLEDHSSKDVSLFSTTMLQDDLVLQTVSTNSTSEAIEDLMASMNIVVFVIIIFSSMLAIVVLFNLTNINVGERIRELCTIKVLGFYPEEVTSYVYRETSLLTLIGIFVGYILGRILHYFIVTALAPSNVMMGLDVHVSSYILSALITLAFSTIVMLIMHRHLKGIDMVESLKAVE